MAEGGFQVPSLRQFCDSTSTAVKTATFLQDVGLLGNQLTCCGKVMNLMPKPKRVTSDMVMWYCGTCRVNKSVRQQSIFAVSSSISCNILLQ